MRVTFLFPSRPSLLPGNRFQYTPQTSDDKHLHPPLDTFTANCRTLRNTAASSEYPTTRLRCRRFVAATTHKSARAILEIGCRHLKSDVANPGGPLWKLASPRFPREFVVSAPKPKGFKPSSSHPLHESRGNAPRGPPPTRCRDP